MAPAEVTSFLRKKLFLTIFEFDIKISEFDFGVLKSSIWKHTTLCDMAVFLPLFSRNFHNQEFNLQVCYFVHICWDIPSEKTGLRQ